MSEREPVDSAMTDDAAVRALRQRALVEPLDLPPPSRRPRWVVRGLVGAVALLFIAVVVLAWREYLGPELQGEPLLVQAEPTPYKVEPSEPAQVQAGETPSRAVMRGSDLPPDRLADREDTPAVAAEAPLDAGEPDQRDVAERPLAAEGGATEEPSTDLALDQAAEPDTVEQAEASSEALADPETAVATAEPATLDVPPDDPLEPLDVEEPAVNAAPAAPDAGPSAEVPRDEPRTDPASVAPSDTPIATAEPRTAPPGSSIRAEPIAPPDGVRESDQPAPLAGVGELEAPARVEPAAVPAVGEVLATLPTARVPRPKPRIAGTSRAAPASTTVPVARVEPAAGGAVWRVQVASMRDDQSARQAWDQVRARHPALLAGLSPTIVRAEVGSGTVYRVQVGPFADRAAANATCTSLKAERTDCLVVGPVR